MSKEHKTPQGWKPCNAKTRACKYETRDVGTVVVIPPATVVDDAVREVEERKPNAVKRFFDSLFGSRGKSSPEVFVPPPVAQSKVSSSTSPTKAPLTAVVKKSLEDTVVLGENGRFQVTSVSPGYSGPLVHLFGDLITDKSNAERLHRADFKQDYQLGECGGLASELWNRNEHVKEYYVIQTDDEPDWGTHHFVQLHDGTCVDSLGLWSAEALLVYWKDTDSSARIGTFDEDAPAEKNPKVKVYNPELFNTVTEFIERHVRGEKL